MVQRSSVSAPAPSKTRKAASRSTRASGAAGNNGNGHARSERNGSVARSDDQTDWDLISGSGRAELEHLVEVLKSVKRGEFSVRFEYQQNGIFGRAGELLNDIFGLTEHLTSELVRVGKVVGQDGRMHERASVGTARGEWANSMGAVNQLIS